VRKWDISLSGGITYIDPIDKNGKAFWETDANVDSFAILALQGVVGYLPNGKFPSDNPTTLKYRNKALIRASLEIQYNKLSLTTNYCYNSPITNVDKMFLVDFPNVLTLFSSTLQFRKDHPNGINIWDIILTYQINTENTLSFHTFNLLNAEYMTIPGMLGPQRNFAVQFKTVF